MNEGVRPEPGGLCHRKRMVYIVTRHTASLPDSTGDELNFPTVALARRPKSGSRICRAERVPDEKLPSPERALLGIHSARRGCSTSTSRRTPARAAKPLHVSRVP